MKIIFSLICLFSAACCIAQSADTLSNGIIVFKDYRLDMIATQEFEINTALLKNKARFIKGFRLMILNTNDKNYAFKVRSQLLQNFPEQKPYMWYSNPYIRLKFGNFRTKEEAEEYRKKISKMMGGSSVYLLNEMIEINPGKEFDPESMREETLK